MAVDPARIPAEEYRIWRLCTLLHCTPSQLDDEAALTLDWLIAVDDTVAKARATLERRAADAR
ncbi:hypothetical protein ABZW30_12385 [Kitasatospora sp. NPDC004669]|uniref:hypothetical protein n=1 Tax=Kitasatospora sp. NPDC004669 TaxID=3154555 RepID=UPI0033AACAD5